MGKMNTVALSMASVLCFVMIVYFLIEIDEVNERRKQRGKWSKAVTQEDYALPGVQ